MSNIFSINKFSLMNRIELGSVVKKFSGHAWKTIQTHRLTIIITAIIFVAAFFVSQHLFKVFKRQVKPLSKPIAPEIETQLTKDARIATQVEALLTKTETFLSNLPVMTSENCLKFFAKENEHNRLAFLVELNSIVLELNNKIGEPHLPKEEREKIIKEKEKLESILVSYFIKSGGKKKSEALSKPEALTKVEEFLRKMPVITNENRSEFFAKENEHNRLALFAEINAILVELRKKMAEPNIQTSEREKCTAEIRKLELAACSIIKVCFSLNSEYGRHATNLRDFPSIAASQYFKNDGSNKKTVSVIDGSNFTQISGLHQEEATNYLCGYYALFFLLQSIHGQDFSDRNEFKKHMNNWASFISQKRAMGSLYADVNKQEMIPYFICKGPIGLSPYEIADLLEKSDIPKNVPWRIIELENLYINDGPSSLDPVVKGSSSEKIAANTPVRLIVKNNHHYYFFQAKMVNNKVELDCVHSLGYKVADGEDFTSAHIADLAKIVRNFYK